MRSDVLFCLRKLKRCLWSWESCSVACRVVERLHLLLKLIDDNILIVNMSAIGAWNNRYEGGPCYAACMETFALYLSWNSAITHLLLSAGRAVTTPLEEWIVMKVGRKRERCAKGSPLSLSSLMLDNCRQSKIWECTQRCSRLNLKVYTGLVWQAFAGNATDYIITNMKMWLWTCIWCFLIRICYC